MLSRPDQVFGGVHIEEGIEIAPVPDSNSGPLLLRKSAQTPVPGPQICPQSRRQTRRPKAKDRMPDQIAFGMLAGGDDGMRALLHGREFL